MNTHRKHGCSLFAQQSFIASTFRATFTHTASNVNGLRESFSKTSILERSDKFSRKSVPCHRRRGTVFLSARYISPTALEVNFANRFRSGSFGAVFLGRYNGTDNQLDDSVDEVVVKCPVDSDMGRKLYDMERHTNVKLATKFSSASRRFPNLVGEIIIPPTMPLSPGLARFGLIWQRSTTDDTLEDYLSNSGVSRLATLLETIPSATPLRRQLSATILRELAYIVNDLQSCGIVHR